MKLFQRLLVAPAALGLMAPVAVNADTAFSSTTTLSGTAFFTVGSVSNSWDEESEELHMQYAYELDLNSSFTGEDSLYVGIEAGNAEDWSGLSLNTLAAMDSAIDVGDSLTVSSLYYAFPVGDLSVIAGPLVDQDDVVAATASAYSDTFYLAALPFSLAGAETGAGIGVSYAADNGIVASASYVSTEANDSEIGINSDEGDDVTTLTLGYDGDGFGGGLVIASNDGDSFDYGYDTVGGGIYYSPESLPATISVSYDTAEDSDDNESTNFFIGLDYEVGPGSLAFAYSHIDTDVDFAPDDFEVKGFEIAYTFNVNDNVAITPGFFSVEEDWDGGEDDYQGVVVETTFSF